MNSVYDILPPSYEGGQLKIIIPVDQKVISTCAKEYPESKRKEGGSFAETLNELVCHSGDKFIENANSGGQSTFDRFLCGTEVVSHKRSSRFTSILKSFLASTAIILYNGTVTLRWLLSILQHCFSN